MPKYSTYVPAIVLPDTEQGREEAKRQGYYRLGVGLAFCDQYRSEAGGRLCGHREYTTEEESRKHSWCFRCPAGYIVAMADGMDHLREELWGTEQRNLRPLW